jgi:RNA polymerase sigma factor (sigma-70 family)
LEAPQQLDPVALERLRFGLRLIALRSLSDAEAAEEVVQETLTRGLEALENGQLDDPHKLGAYFRGICHHVIVDMIRARQRTTSLDTLPEISNGDSSADALQTLISDEQRARVVRALSELSPVSRECLRLSFYEGLKPAEVAARLGEPGPRIRKRRSRALQHLREVFFEQTENTGSHDNESSSTHGKDGRNSGTPDPE